MKKTILAVVLAVILVCSLTTGASAAGFSPSAEAKAAPEVVSVKAADGTEVAGIVYDADGNEALLLNGDDIVITAASEESADPEVNKAMDDAAAEIKNADSLKTLGFTSADEGSVVSDLFDLSLSAEAMNILNAGGTVMVKFKVANGSAIIGVAKRSGKNAWQEIAKDKLSIADNNVTVVFTHLCPVAFLSRGVAVDPENPDVESPKTGYTNNSLLWAGAGLCVLISAGCIALYFRKRSLSK